MCFDSCLRGRRGQCCFGCSTKLGIHLTAGLTLAEIILISSIFGSEIKDGLFNLKVFTWLFIVILRFLSYLSMCCDGIRKRKAFMWTMVVTTLVELVMFTILNIGLFDGSNEEKIFKIISIWGLGEEMQIALIEVLSIVHLGLFIYLCAVAYEYYCMACDDPAMIQREHDQQAEQEKTAAADRKRLELSKSKQGADSGDIEEQQQLLTTTNN